MLSPEFIHPHVVSATENLAPIEPIQEVQDNYTVATRNEEHLPEIDAEEVEPFWRLLHISHVIITFETMLIVMV